MKPIPVISGVATALTLCGCAMPDKVQPETTVTQPPVKTQNVTFSSALALERNGDCLTALKQYSQLIDQAETRLDLHRAVCGKARCLEKQGLLKLAFSSLSPLSNSPETAIDCEKLALAGRILLRMRRYSEAESTLEVALDGIRGHEYEYAPWAAPASANLGNAYLRNKKLKQAKIMFSKAAKLFQKVNMPEKRSKCMRTVMSLEQLKIKRTKE